MKYFGYCTLLDVAEMAKYCPGAKAGSIGRLRGYRVCFSTYAPGGSEGGCNLEKAQGEEIFGLLYEMTEPEFEALDKIAGVDKGYYRRLEAAVTVEGGNKVKAFTYIIPEPGGPFSPSAAYVRPILTGAQTLKLPADYIAQLQKIIALAQTP